MTLNPPAPFFDGSFPHHWQAEILPSRPLILPACHFIYPQQAEEVERGALEVLIRPDPFGQTADQSHRAAGPGFIPDKKSEESIRALAPELHPCEESDPKHSHSAREFLATCALGFRDPAVPNGLWSCPNPEEICAVSGGYAYIISTTNPERFTMIPYRPVLEVRPLPALGLLLFIGHHSVLAWGSNGLAWQSEKLSSEGLTLAAIDGPILHGLGWDLMTDKEISFALDLKTGLRIDVPPAKLSR
jgi:hypothetical protein